MPKADQKQPDNQLAAFERSLGELERLVEELEGGDLELEAALQKFERGVALTRDCQQTLKTAELRVAQLLDNETQETTATAEHDNAPGDAPSQ